MHWIADHPTLLTIALVIVCLSIIAVVMRWATAVARTTRPRARHSRRRFDRRAMPQEVRRHGPRGGTHEGALSALSAQRNTGELPMVRTEQPTSHGEGVLADTDPPYDASEVFVGRVAMSSDLTC